MIATSANSSSGVASRGGLLINQFVFDIAQEEEVARGQVRAIGRVWHSFQVLFS
jgi:hypothetical protein